MASHAAVARSEFNRDLHADISGKINTYIRPWPEPLITIGNKTR